MKTIVVLAIAVALGLSMLPVILSTGLLITRLLPSTAVAQQQTSNVTRPILSLTSGNKTFYELSEEIPEFNETKEGTQRRMQLIDIHLQLAHHTISI
jgi:hypothetical protein